MEAHAADRFLTSWKRVEESLAQRWQEAGGEGRPTSDALLRWAQREQVLPRSSVRFLDACRRARNAYAHIQFDGYDGPVTVPPEPVVQRLVRIASSLATPAKAGTVAHPAVGCTAASSVQEALRLMRLHDFSQLPYWAEDVGWLLVTREQVSAWIDASADNDAHVLVDLATPVHGVSADPRVGTVVPSVMRPSAPVAMALDLLEHALGLDDREPGGYPAVVVTLDGPDASPKILTSDDLPMLYDLLGR